MIKLTLPIPSPVPLDVLQRTVATAVSAESFDANLARPRVNLATRLQERCRECGAVSVWMLAAYRWDRFFAFKNAGRKTANFAQEVLESVGLGFGVFEDLTVVLDTIGRARKKEHPVFGDFPEVLMALAGIGDWAQDETIVPALAAHGLRPGMPLEELFVYVLAVTEPTEPKKLTVAEELLAFGAKQVSEVFPPKSLKDLPEGVTMIEMMARLTVSAEWHGFDVLFREGFVDAARRNLSAAAQKKIGITKKRQRR